MMLAGERIRLRTFADADLDAVHAYASDPQVARYTDWGPNSVADTRAFLDEVTALPSPPGGRYPLAIEVDGQLIGGTQLNVVSAANLRAEIGYVLGRPWWGRGYATEAAGLLLRFGFQELGLHKIVATCHPDNAGSARVLTRIGMTLEGRLRDHVLVRGGWQDRLLFGIVA
jgi:ribosomal-protein-alanine N-acetyltransferase